MNNGEIKQTVIYSVRIDYCNHGAWYKNQCGKKYECILDIYEKPFLGGQIIVMRVLGKGDYKYILPEHCTVLGQRFATHKEAMNDYYGNNKTN